MDSPADQDDTSPDLATVDQSEGPRWSSLLSFLASEPGSPLIEIAPGLFSTRPGPFSATYDTD